MARLLLALLLLFPLATPVRAADGAVEVRLQHLEKDLDQLRAEIKALPEARRLDRLEAEIAGLRAEIKAAEKSAEEAVKDEIKDQDTRIADLSLLLADGANKISVSSYLATWASVLITLSLFVVTAFTALRVPEQAKEAAREKAEEITEKSVIAAKDQATYIATKISADKLERTMREFKKSSEEKINLIIDKEIKPKFIEIEMEADKQRGRIEELFKIEIDNFREKLEISSIIPKTTYKPEKQSDKAQETAALPESDQIFNEWHAMLSYYFENHNYTEMEKCAEGALQVIRSNTANRLLILNLQATSKLKLNKFQESINICDKIINDHNKETDEKVIKQIATAHINKGVAYSNQHLFNKEENSESVLLAIASFNDSINFCSKRTGLDLQHATALYYKASCEEEDLKDEKAAKNTFKRYLLIFSQSNIPEIKTITSQVRQRLNWLDPSALS